MVISASLNGLVLSFSMHMVETFSSHYPHFTIEETNVLKI